MQEIEYKFLNKNFSPLSRSAVLLPLMTESSDSQNKESICHNPGQSYPSIHKVCVSVTIPVVYKEQLASDNTSLKHSGAVWNCAVSKHTDLGNNKQFEYFFLQ